MTAEEILNKLLYGQYAKEEIDDYVARLRILSEAMEQYRNEGLREELRNFADWITKPGFIHVYYYEVDEYLKQKP